MGATIFCAVIFLILEVTDSRSAATIHLASAIAKKSTTIKTNEDIEMVAKLICEIAEDLNSLNEKSEAINKLIAKSPEIVDQITNLKSDEFPKKMSLIKDSKNLETFYQILNGTFMEDNIPFKNITKYKYKIGLRRVSYKALDVDGHDQDMDSPLNIRPFLMSTEIVKEDDDSAQTPGLAAKDFASSCYFQIPLCLGVVLLAIILKKIFPQKCCYCCPNPCKGPPGSQNDGKVSYEPEVKIV